MSMVIVAMTLHRQGNGGCEGAAGKADSESDVTPFLVWCWVAMVVAGLRRAHALLARAYDLRRVRSGWGRAGCIAELTEYLSAIRGSGRVGWPRDPGCLAGMYAKATGRFLFGHPA